jgi:uncharacterized protein (TIGR02246 family)
MGRIWLGVGAIAVVSAFLVQSVSSQPAPKGIAGDDRSADEAAIRQHIEQFAKAYNAHDAKAVAGLFAADGRIESKDGETSEGRDAIEKTFAAIFQQSPQQKLEVAVDSVRFLNPDLAIEVGTTKATNPDEAPEYDRYTVLHVKRDGKWQMAFARDEEGPKASANERLKPLAWLVGEWVDHDGVADVSTVCKWSEDGMFLLQEFKLKLKGHEAMTVSQRIGWDPLANSIRSWVFDSEGGFGEGLWLRDGDDWVIKATGIRPDGTVGSATNYLIREGPDGYVWRSLDRVVADEVQEPVEVKIVRKPPQPKR